MKTYDIIVLGAGGGTKLVSPPANMGKKVAVIEKNKLGGTCLNRGCIPSKMLIHPADVAREIDHAKKFDIRVDTKYSVDFGKLTGRVTRSVAKDSKGIEKFYAEHKNIDWYKGHGRFIGPKIIEVNGKKITAPIILIATGARPFVPPIPGLEGTPYMTSTEALRRKDQPKDMIVIGGGYIGAEMGHFFGGLGTKIKMLVRGRMVAREDGEVIDAFEKEFARYHKVYFDVDTSSVSYKNKEFSVKIKSRKTGRAQVIKAEALLVATGVNPNADDLGLEHTSIKRNKRGYVKVDKFMQTAEKGVYAIGDVVGNYLFRHSVNFEGEYLFDQLFHKKRKTPIQYPPMPHAIFSNPQVAGVGVTEEELKRKGTPYIVGKNDYKDSAMGMALLSDHGFVKLLFHKRTKKLLGAHIIGVEASNMIHMLIAYMTMGAKLDDLLNMIYIHPALPENVRNAARNAKKQI